MHKEFILEVFSKLDENLILLSSDYTKDHSIKLLDKGEIDEFNAVLNVWVDDMEVETNLSIDGTEAKFTLKDLLKLTPEMQNNSPYMCLNRDVEDGFVYSDYDDYIYNDKYLVLL